MQRWHRELSACSAGYVGLYVEAGQSLRFKSSKTSLRTPPDSGLLHTYLEHKEIPKAYLEV